MIVFLYILHILTCLFLMLVVLLQQGSGADLAVFGGGATQTSFGARSATQIIHKLTVWSFVAFILLTLAIAILQGGVTAPSVMQGIEEQLESEAEAAAEEVEPAPAASETTEELLEQPGESGEGGSVPQP